MEVAKYKRGKWKWLSTKEGRHLMEVAKYKRGMSFNGSG